MPTTTPLLMNAPLDLDPNALDPAALWPRLIDDRWLMPLIDAAKAEDLGAAGDITGALTVDGERIGRAAVGDRNGGVLARGVVLGRLRNR